MKTLIIVLIVLLFLAWVFRRGHFLDFYTDLPNLQIKLGRVRRFADIQHVLYINLAKRTDRKTLMETELQRVGWHAFERIDAVHYKPGAIGCALSHIKALEYAKSHKWPHVLICEDDVHFERSPTEVQRQLDAFFSRHTDWDAVLLGCTVLEGKHVDAACVRVRKAYTTHCYLVRQEYYDVLIHNFREVPRRFTEKQHDKPDPEDLLDVVWHSLQQRDRWLMPFPVVATQRPDFSDIYEAPVDYSGFVNAGVGNIAPSSVQDELQRVGS
jgi:hypothetical protein